MKRRAARCLVLVGISTTSCVEYKATTGATYERGDDAVRASAIYDTGCNDPIVRSGHRPGQRQARWWIVSACGRTVRYEEVAGGFGIWRVVIVP